MRATSIRGPGVAVGLVGVGLLATSFAAAAAGTVPGERWQQKITLQLEGRTLPMPGGEFCVPVGKAAAELAKPERTCRISNATQAGNRFSAEVKCTGKDALQGTIEQILEEDHMTGRMAVKSADGDGMLLIDSRKLGACQAVDRQDAAANRRAQSSAAAAAAAQAAECRRIAADLKKNPDQTGLVAPMFVRAGGACMARPVNREFCAVLGTRAGFAGLTSVETGMEGITAMSLAACNLGQGEAGVEAMRERLVRSAELDGDVGFLIANAPDRARELALTQCLLKGENWVGRVARLDRFCGSNFAEDARRVR